MIHVRCSQMKGELDEIKNGIRLIPFLVEVRGIEPLSKHIRRKLSTCLFPYCLSAIHRKRTNQCIT
jgi:hypothetical protein